MHGNYIITSSGKVYSTVRWGGKKRDTPMPIKLIMPYVQGVAKYYFFNEYRRGKKKRSVYIHRAVLTLFGGPRPDGHVAGHKDGNLANNDISNLYWITPKQNGQDTVRHGRSGVGEKNVNNKLNVSQIYLIRDLEGSMSQDELAIVFEVIQPHISRILTKKNWGHLPAADGVDS